MADCMKKRNTDKFLKTFSDSCSNCIRDKRGKASFRFYELQLAQVRLEIKQHFSRLSELKKLEQKYLEEQKRVK